MSLTSRAVKKSDMAYTSASTAENQGESAHPKQRAAQKLVNAQSACRSEGEGICGRAVRLWRFFFRLVRKCRREKKVLCRKIYAVEASSPVPRAMKSAEEILTATAAFCGVAPSMVKTRAVSVQNGFPGGCPGSSRHAVTIYSGQSQYEAPRSRVSQYTINAARNAPQKAMRRH